MFIVLKRTSIKWAANMSIRPQKPLSVNDCLWRFGARGWTLGLAPWSFHLSSPVSHTVNHYKDTEEGEIKGSFFFQVKVWLIWAASLCVYIDACCWALWVTMLKPRSKQRTAPCRLSASHRRTHNHDLVNAALWWLWTAHTDDWRCSELDRK